MNSKAATIVSAIEHATRHMNPPLDLTKQWKPHCSELFRETMRQLKARGVFIREKYMDDKANANELGKRIRESKDDWKEVLSLQDLQSKANQGILVVGSYVNPDHNSSGHLGIVYPADVKRDDPFIRDGNIHKSGSTGAVVAASSYGAVRVGNSFGSILSHTGWFEYRHPIPGN